MADSESKIEVGSDPGLPSAAKVHVWDVPEAGFSIQLPLDLVDQLMIEVMRGFGAVPRRGAEIGGVLLGRIEREPSFRYIVDDFQVVRTEHKLGPSYLLSEPDLAAFEESVQRSNAETATGPRLLGFFRSHTRDTPGLGAEDFVYLQRFFPAEDALALLIRPYATRASTATFYRNTGGVFRTFPSIEDVPFRRKDLDPDYDAASELPPIEPYQPKAELQSPAASAAPPVTAIPEAAWNPGSADPVVPVVPARRSGWFWLPLSLALLLLGLLFGFYAGLTLHPAVSTTDPLGLALAVSADRDNLNLRWDRQAPAVRNARGGVLVIEDGSNVRRVDLDAGQLQTGAVVYHHNAGPVRFRLEVAASDRLTIIESVNWNGSTPPAATPQTSLP